MKRENKTKRKSVMGVGYKLSDDGPAVERPNGKNEYWTNGEKLTEE